MNKLNANLIYETHIWKKLIIIWNLRDIYGIFILSGIVFLVMFPCITGVIAQFYQGLQTDVSQLIENLEEKEELERDPPKMIKMITRNYGKYLEAFQLVPRQPKER